MKKRFAYGLSTAAVLAIGIFIGAGAFGGDKTPDIAGYYTVDINPSVCLAVDAEGRCAVLERPAAGPLGLEADEQDGGARVREALLQVVEDAAAGRHPGGGEDDAGAAHGVDGPGLLGAPREGEARGPEGLASGSERPGHLRVVLLAVREEDRRGVHGHRGVDEDGDLRQELLLEELEEVVEDLLGPTDGERGDEDDPTTTLDNPNENGAPLVVVE